MKRYAVVMAGGSGTRFWPKSSKKRPKQLLNLTGKKSQLQLTWERLNNVVDKRRRAIVCTEEIKKAVHQQVSGAQILAEPEGRNTMAAVCWSVWSIDYVQPDALIAVLPADAFIGDLPGYQRALNTAFDVAENENRIVCLGIKPTFAATGYGYIQQGNKLKTGATEIARFIEKPDAKRAEELFTSGEYLWNAGIFVFPAKLFMSEVRTHAPEFGAFFDKYAQSSTRLRNHYRELPKVSIDVALMEKTNVGALVPGDFGWNDIGSWPALAEVLKANSEAGIVNAQRGHVAIDSQNCIVDVTDGKFVGLVGIKDLIVVETKDAILICQKDQAQKIKDLVSAIEKDKKLAKELL